jgi:lipopolysaccharide biosynthesis regulator YciM
LNLGDVRERQGNLAGAIEAWERLVHEVPDRAYLALERLERAYRSIGAPKRFVDLCQRVITRDPQDWRARLALSRHLAAGGQHRQAFDLLLDALPHNPHGLVIHQEVWQALSALGLDAGLVRNYVDLTRNAVFYLDPHVCVRCRYRSTELLWQCPQCHEWNTFVEERIAPAKDATVAELTES